MTPLDAYATLATFLGLILGGIALVGWWASRG